MLQWSCLSFLDHLQVISGKTTTAIFNGTPRWFCHGNERIFQKALWESACALAHRIPLSSSQKFKWPVQRASSTELSNSALCTRLSCQKASVTWKLKLYLCKECGDRNKFPTKNWSGPFQCQRVKWGNEQFWCDLYETLADSKDFWHKVIFLFCLNSVWNSLLIINCSVCWERFMFLSLSRPSSRTMFWFTSIRELLFLVLSDVWINLTSTRGIPPRVVTFRRVLDDNEDCQLFFLHWSYLLDYWLFVVFGHELIYIQGDPSDNIFGFGLT